MNCYHHENNPANGTCKNCHKAICKECAIDTGRRIACSHECAKDVSDYNLLMDKSKKLYGLDESGTKIQTGTLMTVALGSIMLGTGIYRYFEYDAIDWPSLLIGGVFITFGAMGYVKNKKIGISC
ncbi:hypothetical protein ABT56_14240 [Photobacterium aquae]|uniref:B box-type domain-containing protein n=1 Tax=Photobacterium aquae TaxID=1195763 RepID=A0A0J1GYQ3_9GAMM|nr:hypothetical protein [Photobacterium aquae]KLV04619.1 hypothetical protein ABT56_14240 [Photobacterium aquae]